MSLYFVHCECGKSLPVTATMAGSKIDCSCDRIVTVPRLSALRESNGESAIPMNTVEKIRKKIQQGELPIGEVCPITGNLADKTFWLHVECERAWVKSNEPMSIENRFLLRFILGPLGALFTSGKSSMPEEHGRDTSVSLPIRISSDAYQEISRMKNQSKLKELLRETSIYAELLDEFPIATVST